MLQLGDIDLAPGAADLAGSAPDLAGSAPDLAAPSADLGLVVTAGDTCAGAAMLTAGVTYNDQDTTGLADDYHVGALAAGGCGRNDNIYKEPDAAWAITVPAG